MLIKKIEIAISILLLLLSFFLILKIKSVLIGVILMAISATVLLNILDKKDSKNDR